MAPRPESRIKSLERRATDIEAQIEELSNDTAEELRTTRQFVRQGFEQAHDFAQERFAEVKTTLKDHTEQLKAIREDMAELKGLLLQVINQ